MDSKDIVLENKIKKLFNIFKFKELSMHYLINVKLGKNINGYFLKIFLYHEYLDDEDEFFISKLSLNDIVFCFYKLSDMIESSNDDLKTSLYNSIVTTFSKQKVNSCLTKLEYKLILLILYKNCPNLKYIILPDYLKGILDKDNAIIIKIYSLFLENNYSFIKYLCYFHLSIVLSINSIIDKYGLIWLKEDYLKLSDFKYYQTKEMQEYALSQDLNNRKYLLFDTNNKKDKVEILDVIERK